MSNTKNIFKRLFCCGSNEEKRFNNTATVNSDSEDSHHRRRRRAQDDFIPFMVSNLKLAWKSVTKPLDTFKDQVPETSF
jgi:hypothetical protein